MPSSFLSGGELQRVAPARALMVNPNVILLDEPLSALDPVFREDIRLMLKNLHQTSRTTFLMVTHDFAEVLSLADCGAIMNRRRIEQTGSMEDIFSRPASAFVADFVGMKNIFTARFEDEKAFAGEHMFEITHRHDKDTGYIAIRPEDIVLSNELLDSSMRNTFKGTLQRIIDQGFSYEVHISADDIIFKSMVTKSSLFQLGIREGKEIFLSIKASAIHVF